MRRRTVVFVATVLSLLLDRANAFAGKTPLIDIPLRWRTTEQRELAKVNPQDLASARIAFKPFQDKRAHPHLIGENREDDDKGRILPVTTTADVAKFCGNQMAELFREVGVQVVEDDPTAWIRGEVIQFQVTERNTYVGSVRFKLEVLDADEKVKWTGFAVGTNSRWGRSYKAENYYETLSDGLVNATINLLNDPDFRNAVRSSK